MKLMKKFFAIILVVLSCVSEVLQRYGKKAVALLFLPLLLPWLPMLIMMGVDAQFVETHRNTMIYIGWGGSLLLSLLVFVPLIKRIYCVWQLIKNKKRIVGGVIKEYRTHHHRTGSYKYMVYEYRLPKGECYEGYASDVMSHLSIQEAEEGSNNHDQLGSKLDIGQSVDILYHPRHKHISRWKDSSLVEWVSALLR